MPVAHQFPTKQPVYAVGQKLFALVNSQLTFHAYDFLPNLTNTSNVSNVNWDFGDGTLNLNDGTTATDVTHTYAEIGRYIVMCQVMYGASASSNDTAQSVLVTERQIEIIADFTTLFSAAPVAWVAAIHDTFQDDTTGKTVHALVLLPKLSAVIAGSAVAAATWGLATPGTLTNEMLAQAADDSASRLQAAYAAGFGKMAFPSGQLEQAVWAECGLESVSLGTSEDLVTDMTAVENTWREFARAAGDGQRVVAMANAVRTLVAAVTSLASLTPLAWSPTAYYAVGDRAVGTANIMRWLEYRNQEVDDRIAQSSLATALWRRIAQDCAKKVPEFHADTAWAWETAQAVAQCVYAFYYTLGGTDPGGPMQNAQVLALGDPSSRSLTIYLVDATTKVWAVWQVGLVAATDGTPSFAQMSGKADGSLGGGKFVGVRCVAAGAKGSATIANAWDVRRLETFFSSSMRAASPTFGGSSLTGLISTVSGQISAVLPQITTAFPQDGATRRFATPATDTFIADVVRPAIPLDSFDGCRAGLRPHAALALALGTGFGVRTKAESSRNNCGCGSKSASTSTGQNAASIGKDPITAQLIAAALAKLKA